ncbi:LytR/AlgR family response regulator transcription factor [Faecalibacter bovis]|uniref:Response regulator transcription factor n=1 Tax=Faecalibacter bovis TaxID=2898187 RepID=A0ABX7XBM5_9FLAO|nr:LytTR family DNA-binding domain-containing protein [Faecalibacter bovis]MBS7333763.1 response regulator transcription factor [Weeksellaceae bacterium]QTV05209.1 response regulator transcription factor [Faecalibacter bovis]
MKAIIIDDENRARISLEMMLKEFCPEVEIISSCENLNEGIQAINKQKPDIVFLDIEMPNFSGLDIDKFFDINKIDFFLVFTTAYEEYALKAFKLNAFDYLLKPINHEDLINTVERIKLKQTTQIIPQTNAPIEKIAVPTANNLLFIETKNIIYIKGEGAYSDLILKDKKNILVSKNLKNFEEVLGSDSRFIRVQKSYIVNFDYIVSVSKTNGGTLHLINDIQIPIATDKIQSILDKIIILKK